MSRFAGPKLLRSHSAWALAAVLMVVALLAYQQYRWIGRVAEVEAQTSRQKLDAALKAFGNDFDIAITRANLSFSGLFAESAADLRKKAQERLSLYRQLSDDPALIQSLEIEESTQRPYPTDAMPPFALMVPAFVGPMPKPGKPGRYGGVSFAIQESGSTIRTQRGARIGVRFDGVPLRIRIVLDQKYIASSLLPQLLKRHLGADAEQHYDVLIRSAGADGFVFRWGGEDSRPWESELRMFAVRPECLFGGEVNRIAITAAGPFVKAAGPFVTAAGPFVTAAQAFKQDTASVLLRPASCGDTASPVSGLWRVYIRARPSLGEAVNAARRQNLAVSFGVMLVLAIAIGIVFISGQRARELAARHEQFAAGVSHELRTPLSVISSASENLADGVVESADQMRQYGKMIRAQSEQLSEMIENALWFARRDARDELEVREVDVEELVSAATTTCSRMLEDAGLALERDIEPGLPAVRGNRTLLLHGLQNLLANVAKHGRSGKWVRIRAAREGDRVIFTVEDRGDGIPSDEVKRVFEPFYRGKGARQTNLAGLGLGLSLVRKIVEAHTGKIQLRSKQSRGTTIAFTVPICDPEDSSAHFA